MTDREAMLQLAEQLAHDAVVDHDMRRVHGRLTDAVWDEHQAALEARFAETLLAHTWPPDDG